MSSELLVAMGRIQLMRDEAVEAYGVDLDDPDWGVDEPEAWGVIKTYDNVLDVLAILAAGGVPAQGEEQS